MSLIHTFNNTSHYSDLLKYKSFYEVYLDKKQLEDEFLNYYSPFNLEVKLTFREYFDLVEKYLFFLKKDLNLKAGDKIAVGTGNTVETIILYSAILLNDSIIVPINPDESEEYINNIIKHSEAKVIITDSLNLETNIDLVKIQDIKLNESITPNSTRLTLDSVAVIFYTSGTTGTPKGVALTLGNLFINTEATNKLHNMEQNNVHFSCLPLCHVNAFSFSYMTNLYMGTTLVYQKQFFPINYWGIIKQHNVNIVSSTPHIISLLNQDAREFNEKEYPHLKYFVSASAPLTHLDVKQFQDKYKRRINQAYGLSETVNFSLTIPSELSNETYHSAMLNADFPSAGVPVFGNSIEVMNQEKPELLSEGEVGEIVIRGWNVFNGYINNQLETEKIFKNDYFHTGDIGFFKIIDGYKFFYLNGRVKEISKRNGQLAYLADVESYLKQIFSDLSLCVTVFPNKYTGEELGLVIERTNNLKIDEESLSQAILKLPVYKRPKIVKFSKINRTSTGKPKRLTLGKLFIDYKDLIIKDHEISFEF